MVVSYENAWIELYKKTLQAEDFADCEFESICVGWCLAKGFTVDAAFEFYAMMIKRGYF